MSWVRRNALVIFFASTLLVQCALVWLETQGKSPGIVQRARVYIPAVVAVVLMWVTGGSPSLLKLGKSFIKLKLAPKWWALALLYAPVVTVLPLFLFKLLGLKDHVEYDPNVFQMGAGFFKFVVTIAAVEEISWVSFGIDGLQRRFTPFVSCILGGAAWGIWYVPLNEAGIQVAGQFPSWALVLNFMAIGALCGWLYHHTRSAILVTIMQVLVNYASLCFPVLPHPGHLAVYYVFLSLKIAFVVLMFLLFGPRPMLGTAWGRVVHGDDRHLA